MTREQLLALLSDAVDYIDHSPICDVIGKWSALPPYPVCTCASSTAGGTLLRDGLKALGEVRL